MNETGRRVREQVRRYGGFTDHVFAACSILGCAFVPRIRDLSSKRLYVRTRRRPEAPVPLPRLRDSDRQAWPVAMRVPTIQRTSLLSRFAISVRICCTVCTRVCNSYQAVGTSTTASRPRPERLERGLRQQRDGRSLDVGGD